MAKIGKHNNVPDNKFDLKELNRGIEVEQEHTDDLEIAKNIAKDHLVEIQNYYTLLDEMEAKGKKMQQKQKPESKTASVSARLLAIANVVNKL